MVNRNINLHHELIKHFIVLKTNLADKTKFEFKCPLETCHLRVLEKSMSTLLFSFTVTTMNYVFTFRLQSEIKYEFSKFKNILFCMC